MQMQSTSRDSRTLLIPLCGAYLSHTDYGFSRSETARKTPQVIAPQREATSNPHTLYKWQQSQLTNYFVWTTPVIDTQVIRVTTQRAEELRALRQPKLPGYKAPRLYHWEIVAILTRHQQEIQEWLACFYSDSRRTILKHLASTSEIYYIFLPYVALDGVRYVHLQICTILRAYSLHISSWGISRHTTPSIHLLPHLTLHIFYQSSLIFCITFILFALRCQRMTIVLTFFVYQRPSSASSRR